MKRTRLFSRLIPAIIMAVSMFGGATFAVANKVASTKEVKAEDVLTSSYSYTFESTTFSSNATLDLDGANWKISGCGDYFGYESARGQQFGSGSKPSSNMTLTSNDFADKYLTKLSIDTSGGSSVKATVQFIINGNLVGEAKSITASNNTYEYDVDGSILVTDEIGFKWVQTSKKALYVKSFSVEFLSEKIVLSTPTITFDDTTNSISWTAVENATSYNLVVKNKDTNEYVEIENDGNFSADNRVYNFVSLDIGTYEYTLTSIPSDSLYSASVLTGEFENENNGEAVEIADELGAIKTRARLGIDYSEQEISEIATLKVDTTSIDKSTNLGSTGISETNLGLDSNLFEITAYKVEGSNNATLPGLNKIDGTFRVYMNTYVVIRVKTGEITSVKPTFASGDKANNEGFKLSLTQNGSALTPNDDGEYIINSSSFVISNTNTGTGATQVWFEQIDIGYQSVLKEFSNVRARFLVEGIPADVYESELLEDAEWGVVVRINGKEKTFIADTITKAADGTYGYVVSITDIPETAFKTVMNATGYVDFLYGEGVDVDLIHVEMISTEYSIETMVQTYLDSVLEADDPRRDLLVDFQNKYGLDA